MPEKFLIELFSPRQGVYFPGETISGNVILVLSKELKARHVTVSVLGKARTHWTVSETHTTHDNKTHTESIPYWSEIIYTDQKICVWDSCGDSKKIAPGEYRYPFSFQLPIHLPPSFEGCYGYIRYHIKARIDRPWHFDDKISSPFTIASFFDLNTVPHVGIPTIKAMSKNLGVLMFKHGHLDVKIHLPKTGFVPGEAINLFLEINNTSSRDVEEVRLSLVQHAVFKADRHGHSHIFLHCNDINSWGINPWQHRSVETRREDRILAKNVEKVDIQKHSQSTYTRMLTIPPTAPSFNICPIIDVSYFLKIKVVAKGHMSNELKCELPVLLGTVPIHQAPPQPNMPAQPMQGVEHPANIAPPLPSAPPAYEESQMAYGDSEFGKSQVLEGNDDDKTPDYTPKYIYYKPTPQVVEKM